MTQGRDDLVSPQVQTRQLLHSQKLVDLGIRVQRVCELCHFLISEATLRYCPHCDAGPLHEACIIGHLCPLVLGGKKRTETLKRRWEMMISQTPLHRLKRRSFEWESKISSQKSTLGARCTLRKGSQLHDFPTLVTKYVKQRCVVREMARQSLTR